MSGERHTVFYSGRVQGVGFRYTTRQLASSYDVKGYVRNLPDGRVELVVEGNSGQVGLLLKAISERMGDFIREVLDNVEPATGEFEDFGIRH